MRIKELANKLLIKFRIMSELNNMLEINGATILALFDIINDDYKKDFIIIINGRGKVQIISASEEIGGRFTDVVSFKDSLLFFEHTKVLGFFCEKFGEDVLYEPNMEYKDSDYMTLKKIKPSF